MITNREHRYTKKKALSIKWQIYLNYFETKGTLGQNNIIWELMHKLEVLNYVLLRNSTKLRHFQFGSGRQRDIFDSLLNDKSCVISLLITLVADNKIHYRSNQSPRAQFGVALCGVNM